MRFKRCFAPYNSDLKHSKELRTVPESITKFFPSVSKTDYICDSCRRKVTDDELSLGDYFEIVKNLKQKLHSEDTAKNDKILLSQLLPSHWSVREVANFSNISVRQSHKNKSLKNLESSLPPVTSHNRISDKVIEKVKMFYEDDENSRILPGMKDTKCIKEDGKSKFVQKRLVLYTLRELYLKFKESNTDIKIGFSKFAEFRPKNCVLAGASGTHNVCVCVHHQNVKLMLAGLDISRLTSGTIKDYKDCISNIVCQNPQPDCFLNKCTMCPGVDKLISNLQELLHRNHIDQVKYLTWHTTDRSNLTTRIDECEDFLQCFSPALLKLKLHSFIAKKQSAYYQHVKDTLSIGEFLISMDFSENYAFVAQDAAQSFHYNNNQCSLATAVIYFKDINLKTCHLSVAVFSDVLTHDTVAVYCVQTKIIDFLRSSFSDINKIIYFTDGAAQHFKNKYNFQNVRHHFQDFEIKAEWHFHATAHGKNACDGVGASIKSNARRASLRTTLNNILTPQNLYDWASVYFKNIMSFYLSKDEYNSMKEKLKKRFESAITIPGTLTYHCVKSTKDANRLELKEFSASETCKIFPPVEKGRKRSAKPIDTTNVKKTKDIIQKNVSQKKKVVKTVKKKV